MVGMRKRFFLAACLSATILAPFAEAAAPPELALHARRVLSDASMPVPDSGRFYLFVDAPISKPELSSMGLRYLGLAGQGVYLVSRNGVSQSQLREALAAKPQVVGTAAFAEEDLFGPRLSHALKTGGDALFSVQVGLSEAAKGSTAKSMIGGYPRTVLQHSALELNRHDLARLSALPEVAFLDLKPKRKLSNNESRKFTKSEKIAQSPLSLTGKGILVGVWDGGKAEHSALEGRVTNTTTLAADNHATHVSGTIGADPKDSEHQKYHGHAREVTIHAYSFNADPMNRRLEAQAKIDQHFDNHSWNAGVKLLKDYGALNQDGLEFEQSARFSMMLGVKAAGNSGPQGTLCVENGVVRQIEESDDPFGGLSINPGRGPGSGASAPDGTEPGPDDDPDDSLCAFTACPKGTPYGSLEPDATVKNILVIGSADRHNAHSCFSASGPTKDGRIKPDIVTDGKMIMSCVPPDPSRNHLTEFWERSSGTSMATPGASGTLALLAEQYEKLYPNTRWTVDWIRGLVIQNAADIGPAGPDYQFGWGALDAEASANFMIANHTAGERMTPRGWVKQGETREFLLYLEEGKPELRVTLSWLDSPITSLTPVKRLVQDLDLEVVGPDDSVHYPYNLDPKKPHLPAVQTAKNTRDNVEQVRIANPQAGFWRVRVKGSSVTAPEQPNQGFVLFSSQPFEGLVTHRSMMPSTQARIANADGVLDVPFTVTSTKPAGYVRLQLALYRQAGVRKLNLALIAPSKKRYAISMTDAFYEDRLYTLVPDLHAAEALSKPLKDETAGGTWTVRLSGLNANEDLTDGLRRLTLDVEEVSTATTANPPNRGGGDSVDVAKDDFGCQSVGVSDSILGSLFFGVALVLLLRRRRDA